MADPDEDQALQQRIGAVIAELRGRRSQAEIAKASGVNLATVSRIETGRANPSLGTLSAIARALGVPVDRLFFGNEEWERRNAFFHQGSFGRSTGVADVRDREVTIDVLVQRDSEGRLGVSATPGQGTFAAGVTPLATVDGRLEAVEGREDDLEDRVDLLTRALRQVLGADLDAAIVQQEAQAGRSPRRLPAES